MSEMFYKGGGPVYVHRRRHYAPPPPHFHDPYATVPVWGQHGNNMAPQAEQPQQQQWNGEWSQPGDGQFEVAEGEFANTDEPFEYDEESYDEQTFVQQQQQQMQMAANAHAEYLKKCAEHPLAQQTHDYVKVSCNECNGHTLLKDGQVDEMVHTKTCNVLASGGKNAAASAAALAVGCHKCGKCDKCKKVVHLHAYPAPPPPPADDDCDSDDDDCEEEVAPVVCDKKPAEKGSEGQVVEFYVDTSDSLAKKLAEAHGQDTPICARFEQRVLSADGKSAAKIAVAVKTSKRNAQGKSALHLELTPFKDGKKLIASRFEVPMWHIDHNESAGSDSRVKYLKSGGKVFHEKEVPKEIVFSAVEFVQKALDQMK